MASWTTPTTYAVGNVLSVSAWNASANNETFLYQAPSAYYYDSSGTTIGGSSVPTTVQLGGTVFTKYGFSVSSNLVSAPIAGVYACGGAIGFSSIAGQLITSISHNGTQQSGASGTVSSGSLVVPVTSLIAANAADTFSLVAQQNTAGGITTLANSMYTYIHLFFVGSL